MSVQTSLDRLKKQLNLKANAGETVALRKPTPLQPAFYQPAEFPEYRDYANMGWYYEKQGYEQSQFRSHLGVSDAVVQLHDRQLINFSSYNYLGLAGDERVKARRNVQSMSTVPVRVPGAQLPVRSIFTSSSNGRSARCWGLRMQYCQ